VQPKFVIKIIKKATLFPFWKTSLLAALFGQGPPARHAKSNLSLTACTKITWDVTADPNTRHKSLFVAEGEDTSPGKQTGNARIDITLIKMARGWMREENCLTAFALRYPDSKYFGWLPAQLGLGCQQKQQKERYVLGSFMICNPPQTLSIYPWLYCPLLDLGHFLSFLSLYTVGSTPWTSDQPVARPLPTHTTT
jgi:hypothetical protein